MNEFFQVLKGAESILAFRIVSLWGHLHVAPPSWSETRGDGQGGPTGPEEILRSILASHQGFMGAQWLV